MVYPHSNAIGKEKPPPKPQTTMDSIGDMLKEVYLGAYSPPVYSPSAFKASFKALQELPQPIDYWGEYGQPWLPSAFPNAEAKKAAYDKLFGKKPEPPKGIVPDCPVYSQQAHALRFNIVVEGFGIDNPKIGTQWMLSNHKLHADGGKIPVNEVEHYIDVMLANVKTHLMNQIKEKAK